MLLRRECMLGLVLLLCMSHLTWGSTKPSSSSGAPPSSGSSQPSSSATGATSKLKAAALAVVAVNRMTDPTAALMIPLLDDADKSPLYENTCTVLEENSKAPGILCPEMGEGKVVVTSAQYGIKKYNGFVVPPKETPLGECANAVFQVNQKDGPKNMPTGQNCQKVMDVKIHAQKQIDVSSRFHMARTLKAANKELGGDPCASGFNPLAVFAATSYYKKAMTFNAVCYTPWDPWKKIDSANFATFRLWARNLARRYDCSAITRAERRQLVTAIQGEVTTLSDSEIFDQNNECLLQLKFVLHRAESIEGWCDLKPLLAPAPTSIDRERMNAALLKIRDVEIKLRALDVLHDDLVSETGTSIYTVDSNTKEVVRFQRAMWSGRAGVAGAVQCEAMTRVLNLPGQRKFYNTCVAYLTPSWPALVKQKISTIAGSIGSYLTGRLFQWTPKVVAQEDKLANYIKALESKQSPKLVFPVVEVKEEFLKEAPRFPRVQQRVSQPVATKAPPQSPQEIEKMQMAGKAAAQEFSGYNPRPVKPAVYGVNQETANFERAQLLNDVLMGRALELPPELRQPLIPLARKSKALYEKKHGAPRFLERPPGDAPAYTKLAPDEFYAFQMQEMDGGASMDELKANKATYQSAQKEAATAANKQAEKALYDELPSGNRQPPEDKVGGVILNKQSERQGKERRESDEFKKLKDEVVSDLKEKGREYLEGQIGETSEELYKEAVARLEKYNQEKPHTLEGNMAELAQGLLQLGAFFTHDLHVKETRDKGTMGQWENDLYADITLLLAERRAIQETGSFDRKELVEQLGKENEKFKSSNTYYLDTANEGLGHVKTALGNLMEDNVKPKAKEVQEDVKVFYDNAKTAAEKTYQSVVKEVNQIPTFLGKIEMPEGKWELPDDPSDFARFVRDSPAKQDAAAVNDLSLDPKMLQNYKPPPPQEPSSDPGTSPSPSSDGDAFMRGDISFDTYQDQAAARGSFRAKRKSRSLKSRVKRLLFGETLADVDV